MAVKYQQNANDRKIFNISVHIYFDTENCVPFTARH